MILDKCGEIRAWIRGNRGFIDATPPAADTPDDGDRREAD